jgi:hypothetical protein
MLVEAHPVTQPQANVYTAWQDRHSFVLSPSTQV